MKVVIFLSLFLFCCGDSHQKQIDNLKESLGSCVSTLQKERAEKQKVEKCSPQIKVLKCDKIKVTKTKYVVSKEFKKRLEACQENHDNKMQKFAECISLIKEGTKVMEQCTKDKASQQQTIRKCNEMLQKCKRN